MVTVEDATKMALAFPDVTEGARWNNTTWSVNGKTFAWLRPFSKADIKRFGDVTPPKGPIIALVVTDLMEKDAAIAANPKSFFTIEHFNGYAAILVQLDKVTKTALKAAMTDAYAICATPKPPKPKKPKDRRAR